MTAETPAERFARRQAERDAERAMERRRIRDKAAAEPIHHKRETAPAPAMYPKSDQLARLCGLLDAGSSVREAARIVGCSRGTAEKAYRTIVAERAISGLPLPMCPCGRPATHRGWCRPRFQKHPGQQQVMAALHRRQRGGLATWERVP